MHDRIIEGFLKAFVDEYGLGDLDEPSAFERFVNYCVIAKHYADSFDPEEVTVGGSGDLGLDGIGIIVNDNLVFSKEDVDHFKKQLRRLDAQFVFVQAKTSPKFDAAELGNFVSGVRLFFEKQLPETTCESVWECHKLKEYIFDRVIDMDQSPICRMYYVTTGTWLGDRNLKDRIAQGERDLGATGLFSQIDIVPIDAESLKRIHRELHQKIAREFVFEKHAILPVIANVEEAYIGIVPCLEYLKLIREEDGSLNRRLFYDNVRDFQGHNSVNSEIERTLMDAGRNDRFALLNNGVTIVARDANKVGTTFRLRDYQIVNGCQTSHILFLNQKHLTPSVYVPIKLIVTTDGEVTNQITQGTNRQTEVKLEAFESLNPFQKKLEEFYNAMDSGRPNPLYYERRSKQYEQIDVQRNRIISLATQVKCFVAMFLNEPHSTHRYYGELLSSYRGRVFSEAHSPMPYFVSGLALATVEQLFAGEQLPREWRPFKFQMLMVLRIQNEPREVPSLNATKAIDKYCEVLLVLLDDKAKAEGSFRRAGELIAGAKAKIGASREQAERTRSFTTTLIDVASAGKGAHAAIVDRQRGTVYSYSEPRGFGHIDGDDGSRYFVHIREVRSTGVAVLYKGQIVAFSVVEDKPSNRAVDVEIVE